MATALIADAICSAYRKRKNYSHVNYVCNSQPHVLKIGGKDGGDQVHVNEAMPRL
jgi:hypothetical protein